MEVKDMRRLITLLALAFTLALVPAIPAQAKKPLVGTMDLEFNLDWPGPQQTDIPDWVGNITIDSTEYGMAFFAIGSGKEFEAVPGKVHFFEEIWRIYDWVTFNFTTQVLDYGEILLWGYDVGQTCLNGKNYNYHMNGNVEVAVGGFAVWEGRNVHISGEIEWQEIETPEGPALAPHYAPGTFRIN